MRKCAEYFLALTAGGGGGGDGDDGGRTREMRVKASGGVRSVRDAVRFLEAGASRLGTSGSVAIVEEAAGEGGSAGAEEEGKRARGSGGY